MGDVVLRSSVCYWYSQPFMRGCRHFSPVRGHSLCIAAYTKTVMASSSHVTLGDNGVAAVVAAAVPDLVPLGYAAGGATVADECAVHSVGQTLAESIRFLTQRRDLVSKIKADLSRQLKNARQSLKRYKLKKKAPRRTDLFELHAMRSEAGSMSVHSEPTAATDLDV